MSLAIITGGFLPVPASKGGAVENLIENFINMNEIKNDIKLTVFSTYDVNAERISKNYKYTKCIFYKVNPICKVLDSMIFFFAKNILRKKNCHSYRFIMQRLDFLNKVSRNLKNYDYDKVLLENHPTLYLALKWRKNYIKYDGRYYYHCHNEFPGTYGCKNIIDKTKKFISVSEYRQNNIKQYLNNQCDYIVVKNGIDTSKFTKDLSKERNIELRKKYNISIGEKIIIFVGRLIEGKGAHILLESLEYVKSNDYKVLIVGSALNTHNVMTSYEEKILKLAEKYKDKVRFTGFVNYDDLYEMYKLAYLAVLPSFLGDSAPLTVIESIICNVPLITTNDGGIPEYVNKDCAIIIDTNTELKKEIGESIDFLVNNKSVVNKMSLATQVFAKEYTIDNYYKEFINSIK